ncbi:hypothetical protein Aduo_016636 [Ancylostoma duodenale]
MRTDDPVRTTVTSAVAEQTAVVKQVVSGLISDLQQQRQAKASINLLKILEEAGISDEERLVALLDTFMSLKKAMDVIAEKLQCAKEELPTKVTQLFEENETNAQKIIQLSIEVKNKDFQVEQLRERVEHLEIATVAQNPSEEPEIDGKIDTTKVDPLVLRAYAEQCIRKQSRNGTIVGHKKEK